MRILGKKLVQARYRFVPLVSFIVIVVSLAAFDNAATARWSASDPFVGNWKLNPSKSTLIDQMKVEATAANTYALTFSPAGTETIRADGTDQQGLFGTTVSITVEAHDSWKIVRKKDGRTLLTGMWKLSEDGKTLRDHYTEYAPNGSPSSIDYVYTRTTGRSGFTGTWDTPIEKVNSFELQIAPWESGLSFVTPDQHRTQNVKFDGKEYPVIGSDVIGGSTSSGRRLSKHTLEITEKIKGKVTITRRMVLSSDEKTLTSTVYPAGRSKPNILVFDRE
jgi:hypothetical protein